MWSSGSFIKYFEWTCSLFHNENYRILLYKIELIEYITPHVGELILEAEFLTFYQCLKNPRSLSDWQRWCYSSWFTLHRYITFINQYSATICGLCHPSQREQKISSAWHKFSQQTISSFALFVIGTSYIQLPIIRKSRGMQSIRRVEECRAWQ